MSELHFCSVFQEELTSFVNLRKSQGIKDKNVYILRRLDEYLVAHNVTEKEFTPEIVDGWLATSNIGISGSTLAYYRAYCMKFSKYLLTLGFPAFVPEYIQPDDAYVPYIFSSNEIERIFNIADNMTKNGKLSNVQYPLLLRILYSCGLRLGEALNLKIADVDIINGVFYIWNSKDNRDKLVPMDKTLVEILQIYSNAVLAGKPTDSYLFESNYKNCVNRPRSQSWAKFHFSHILKDAGIEVVDPLRLGRNICLHCLRHTFAVNSFRKQDLAGVDNYRIAPLLSVYLGHAKLERTQKYLHMTAENSADIIDATNKYSKGLFPEVPQ